MEPALNSLLAPRSRSPLSRIQRGTYRVAAPLVAPLASQMLRRRASSVTTVDDALNLAYSFSVGGIDIMPMQVRSELCLLLTLVQALQPRAVIEIGTAHGGTLFCLARVAARDATIISVDLRHGEFGGGYPSWRRRLYRSILKDDQKLVLIEGDSHAESTHAAVVEALDGQRADFLLIDGDHTRAGVLADFEMYTTLLGTRGVVGLHDIVPDRAPPTPPGAPILGTCSGDVPDVWQFLRDQHPSEEFVEDSAQCGFGIGVLYGPWETQSDVSERQGQAVGQPR